MIMRLKPIRGYFYPDANGIKRQFIEECSNDKSMVKIIGQNGTIEVIPKSDLDLPEIDTSNYEKVIPKNGRS